MGNLMYFKRLSSNQWQNPAKVLGQNGQKILVENRSSYHHMHPCRLQLINNPPKPNILSQSNEHNAHPFINQSISAKKQMAAI